MYMTRFGVKNYKCLGDIDIPLTPIHVLIGQNDAGKTSLLEAMAAFLASRDKTLSEVFRQPWTGRELVFHGSPDPFVEFRAEWGDGGQSGSGPSASHLRYGFRADFVENQVVCDFGHEHLEIDGASVPVKVERRTVSTTALWHWSHHRDLSSQITPDIVGLISNAVVPAHEYSFDPSLMAVPAAFDPSRKFRLDRDGFGLSTLLMDILGNNVDSFVSLRKAFLRSFPQYTTIRVELEQAYARREQGDGTAAWSREAGTGIYFDTHSGKAVRAQQASDGAILILGYLALAHLPEAPNLLLIEEPENGIYPTRLREVITLLKEMVRREDGIRFPHIIMSTHSPYVLSFFEPEEVTFLSRPTDDPDGPVRARPLRDAPNIKERLSGGFYLGELWYNLTEEELFGDA